MNMGLGVTVFGIKEQQDDIKLKIEIFYYSACFFEHTPRDIPENNTLHRRLNYVNIKNTCTEPSALFLT
jgi:hypothetical protein